MCAFTTGLSNTASTASQTVKRDMIVSTVQPYRTGLPPLQHFAMEKEGYSYFSSDRASVSRDICGLLEMGLGT